MELVAGRECGSCTACCRELTIEDPALAKPAGRLCTHCADGSGCSIYEMRPATCRDWFCGWRYFGWMDEAGRPDRSGLLVVFTQEGIPGGPQRVGLVFNLLADDAAGDLDLLLRAATVGMLGALVREQVPVFLGVRQSSRRPGIRMTLNEALAPVAHDRDGERLKATLRRTYEAGCRAGSGSA